MCLYKCAICHEYVIGEPTYIQNHKCYKIYNQLTKPMLRYNQPKALYCVACRKLFNTLEDCDWFDCGHRKHIRCDFIEECCMINKWIQ